MAVIDDLKKLAELDVVYLTRWFVGAGSSPMEAFRGRLRQALNGAWVFTTFTGANGVVGFDLGMFQNGWNSAESPSGGLSVQVPCPSAGTPFQVISVSSVLPSDFAD